MSSNLSPFRAKYAVNLDGFPCHDSLSSFLYALPRRGIPVAYRDYATLKVCAMRARAAGRVAAALSFEALCETCYRCRIPALWRW